ncbi:MAG: FxsA family protein [Sulfuricellaceae bacterium]
MHVFLVLAILLGFLVLEIFTLVRLAAVVGWWLAPWLLCVALAGWWWLRKAGFVAARRLLRALPSGQPMGACILYGFIPFVAGILLIFPGVISDVIALLLLLIPPPPRRDASQENDLMEGEWRRMDDWHDRLK